jgi:hypothetical protein
LHVDALKFQTALTSEKIKCRLENIRAKIDLETKVNSGAENLVSAMKKEQKAMIELEAKVKEAKTKIQFLRKAESRYVNLFVPNEEEEETEVITSKRY